ncbi:hypothetical protein [Desulfofundulus kuznetsovii]
MMDSYQWHASVKEEVLAQRTLCVCGQEVTFEKVRRWILYTFADGRSPETGSITEEVRVLIPTSRGVVSRVCFAHPKIEKNAFRVADLGDPEVREVLKNLGGQETARGQWKFSYTLKKGKFLGLCEVCGKSIYAGDLYSLLQKGCAYYFFCVSCFSRCGSLKKCMQEADRRAQEEAAREEKARKWASYADDDLVPEWYQD